MKIRSWCGYCSRDYHDRRWLTIDGTTITCPECGGTSTMKPDKYDEGYFELERKGNGRKHD